jgi:hypothetical protein
MFATHTSGSASSVGGSLNMNVFNRLFTIVGLLTLLVGGVITLIAPATMLALIQNAADTLHRVFFIGMSDWARLIMRIITATIFALIALALLWLEVRRPAQKSIQVTKAGGTMIRISTDAVESKLRDAIDGLPGVIGSKVVAQTRGKAIAVQLDVLATKETDLVSKAEEIAAVTHTLIQDQLGLKLHGRPQIVIKAGAGRAKTDKKSLFPSFGRDTKPKPAQPAIAEPVGETPMVSAEPVPEVPNAPATEIADELEQRRRIATDG